MTDLNLEGLTDAQLRLFAVRCARRVQHLMTDPRSVAVIDVAERHAKGEATDDELSEARAAAWFAPRAAWFAPGATVGVGWDAGWAAWYAAWAFTHTSRAAADAAATAAWAASAVWRVTARSVADAAWDAERAEQQKILDEVRNI